MRTNVYRTAGNTNDPAAVSPVNSGARGVAPSVGGSCNTRLYSEITGTSFTLAGTNGGGAAANIKMQSADDVVESIQGTLGAISFSVNELPDRAGLALGGATLLGIDALRKRLLRRDLLVSYVNYSASAAAQLNNPLKVIYGQLDGSLITVSKSVSKDANNQQYVSTLIPITGEWLLTGNAALQMVVNAGVTVGLTFVTKAAGDFTTN